jgi:predicted flap endonuclease-1-like 5' DNA nuclease
MNQPSITSGSQVRVGAFAFIAGLIIGLVVLGWWLWPVNWTGGDIEHLNPADRLDYLRAAIDSYAVNQDATIAQSRYKALGPYNQTALYEIYSTAGEQNRQSIGSFAAAVMASDVLTGQFETAALEPARLPLMSILSNWPVWKYTALVGLLALLILLAIITSNVRHHSKQGQVKNGSTVTTFDTPLEENRPLETQPDFALSEDAINDESELPPDERQVLGEIPDWLQETSTGEVQPAITEMDLDEEGELSEADIAAISAGAETFTEPEAEAKSIPENLAEDGVEELRPITDEEHQQVSDMGETKVGEVSEAAAEPVSIESELSASSTSDELQQTTMEEEQPAPAIEEPELPDETGEQPVSWSSEETQEQTRAKFSLDLGSLPGFLKSEAQKLESIGLTAPLLVLRGGASEQSRQAIANKAGIDPSSVLQWVNFSDLLRIKGLQPNNAQALMEVGVSSINDLANVDPPDLYEWMRSQAATSGSVFTAPIFEQVKNWVKQAKELPRIVT